MALKLVQKRCVLYAIFLQAAWYCADVNDLEKLQSSPKSSLTKATPFLAPNASVLATDSVLAKGTLAPVPTTRAAATNRPHLRIALNMGIQKKNECVLAPWHSACRMSVKSVVHASTESHAVPKGAIHFYAFVH